MSSFTQEALDSFLSTFERNTTSSDPAVVIAQFAETFLAAGPAGSTLVPAATFAQMLPSRRQYFEKAGLRASQLIARHDMQIGERYVLVDTQWKMDFAPTDKPEITLTVGSAFLIDMGSSDPKILAYLTHQDIYQLIQEHNLSPQPS
ncbi:hypothetical protein ACPOL_2124 [Acidisarcina polymorpha]|uniref:SnoaL-like domain-containing protein n=1 Tax=Acidisarcina polymorpha TaxID=2211140 RepID=A0A2Z5FX42_9BACT|nr:hypothetical protein [Acidisarcina polymorpha]AXC11448.1 hypothetical protein ACPOL_2124 [Acidisarcina polymorpha]